MIKETKQEKKQREITEKADCKLNRGFKKLRRKLRKLNRKVYDEAFLTEKLKKN